MPGPYFSNFYSYAEGITKTDYFIIGLWIVLLVIVAFSMYSLKKSINELLDEVKDLNAVAHQLKEQNKSIDKLLEEI
ncbi:hypothetical protein [Thermococcus paralvinellae]|uniref:hypothetical protein n=1 Tax=Thermococcus paralvinellae TaxID=582419 RepID=UPI0005B28675|nr:hypothetical protein [Thermococcus paralvinellae]